MKKIIFRIVGVLVLLVIIALAGVFFSLNSLVKKGVETVGPKLTKVEIKLNRVSLSPLSGHGQLTGLFVGNPQGFKTPSAIQMGDVEVALKPSSVFSQTVVIDSIRIQAPEITLEGSLEGNNLTKILDNLNAAVGSSAPAAKPDQTAKKPETKFILKDVLIEGGKINLGITALGGKALPVPLPTIHLQDIGTKENGVTAAQASQKIMQALLANVTKAASQSVANLGKGLQDAGKSAVDEATKGIKNLFK